MTYNPETSLYTPEQYIELSRLRRKALCIQIRDLRYEYEDLLAEEIRVNIEFIGEGNGIVQA